MKIRPVGPQLFHTDEKTDKNLTVAFRNFMIASKKGLVENPTSLQLPSLSY